MLKDSSAFRHYVSALIVLIGAITTLVPAFAHSWISRRHYTRYRPIVLLIDNVLQVALGCFTHTHIYPEEASDWRGATNSRAVGVLLTGSGVAWLNMSSLLGSLIFRFAMGQQAVLTIIMLLASPTICARSFSLQRAHMGVHSVPSFAASHLLPIPLLRHVPLLSFPTLDPGSQEDSEYALAVCVTYQQIALLGLGLIAPTLYLYWREIKTRTAFAKAKVRYMPDVLGVSLNPPPTMLQYWAFAAPAAAALYFYVALKLV